MGPEGGNAHAPDEWVRADNLPQTVYVCGIVRVLRQVVEVGIERILSYTSKREHMGNNSQRDPWVYVRTRNDFAADEVISALQKEIRRGNVENAVLLAYEMVTTSPEMEEKLWKRLMIICVEDIGAGEPNAPVLIHTLYQMKQIVGAGAPEGWLYAVHAVRMLCAAPKDRSSEEMAMWISRQVEAGRLLPSIPDYALDMHTARGQQMGRDLRHFLEEGTRLHPEAPDRDRTYQQRLKKLVEEKH
jgi:replication-associated recombination protein RarA